MDIDEKLHPQGDRVFGHGEWGIGHGEEVTCLTHALCPKGWGDYPSPPTFAQHPVGRGWSFLPLSMNSITDVFSWHCLQAKVKILQWLLYETPKANTPIKN
ncbi:MAG: hypothetical protein V7L04_19915 [Nostoc sp.]|uniref:hypothetical protein n=1 Tax=Nostoc sp. TaxID=1180 RepID=UPI002FF55435